MRAKQVSPVFSCKHGLFCACNDKVPKTPLYTQVWGAQLLCSLKWTFNVSVFDGFPVIKEKAVQSKNWAPSPTRVTDTNFGVLRMLSFFISSVSHKLTRLNIQIIHAEHLNHGAFEKTLLWIPQCFPYIGVSKPEKSISQYRNPRLNSRATVKQFNASLKRHTYLELIVLFLVLKVNFTYVKRELRRSLPCDF